MRRRLIPVQQPIARPPFPALISTINALYPVLANLSAGYPDHKGRSPTRYSPVRHFPHVLLHFRVRLACVRRAASVDSEPGSNSHVKFAVPRRARLRELAREQLFNARPIYWLCVVQSVFMIVVYRQPPSHGLTTPVGRFCGPTR